MQTISLICRQKRKLEKKKGTYHSHPPNEAPEYQQGQLASPPQHQHQYSVLPVSPNSTQTRASETSPNPHVEYRETLGAYPAEASHFCNAATRYIPDDSPQGRDYDLIVTYWCVFFPCAASKKMLCYVLEVG